MSTSDEILWNFGDIGEEKQKTTHNKGTKKKITDINKTNVSKESQ